MHSVSNRHLAALFLVVGALLVVWPYAFYQVNWYNRVAWDGIVSIGGELFSGHSLPVWFYLMLMAPLLSLCGGFLLFINVGWTRKFGLVSAVISLVQFPFGTVAGLVSFILLWTMQSRNTGEQAVPPKSDRAGG